MIHVCYGIYDGTGRYSKFTGTSILSMFENTRAEVTVHLLHDDTLTDDNRDKFSYIAGQYNQLIKFYNVKKICANELAALKKKIPDFFLTNFSIGAIFRLLMPQLFPKDIEKIIYLDSDTIVNLDIGELWNIPIEDEPIAAIPEMENGVSIRDYLNLCRDGLVNAEDYFNSGVLVINLGKLRENEFQILQDGIKFIAENPQYNNYMDQNILNYCFSKNYLILPIRFNFFVRESRWRNEFNTENRILHYLSGSLKLDTRDIFNQMWFSYFEKTPWFNKEILGHIYEQLIKFNTVLKSLAVQTSAFMSGKVRAFFTAESNVKTIKQIFCIKEGEEIVSFVNQESIQVLKESMKASAGKKIYFILIGNRYHIIRSELMKEGFVEGRDFLNAIRFLSEGQGVPLDTYDFIKSL